MTSFNVMAAPDAKQSFGLAPTKTICALRPDLDWRHVVGLVESGELMAVNVAARPSGRRELRSLPEDVYNITHGRPCPKRTADQFVRLALPPVRFISAATLPAAQLKRLLAVSGDLIKDLIDGGELVVAKTAWSPLVTYASAVEFLKRRVQ